MTEQKVPTKAQIEKAVLLCLANDVKMERKVLISKSIEKHGFSQDELKDRSCESLSTELKSLTGVVINEMIVKNLIVNENGSFFVPKPIEEIVKSGLIVENNLQNEKIVARKKRKHKKNSNISKKIDEKENTVSNIYPDTELGKILEDANKKYNDYLIKKSNALKDKQQTLKQAYISSLKRSITSAINIAGGEFFEELSMKLLLACYGDCVVKNELTGGPDDNGIDGIITIKDAFGFEEKVYFQAKTKISERKNVSIKVARELLGVMTADKVTKGIVITNSSFVKDTKNFVNKVPHLALIDINQLFEMMCKYSIGIKMIDGNLCVDDNLFLSI